MDRFFFINPFLKIPEETFVVIIFPVKKRVCEYFIFHLQKTKFISTNREIFSESCLFWTEVRLHYKIYFRINRNMLNTTWFRFDLTRSRFSWPQMRKHQWKVSLGNAKNSTEFELNISVPLGKIDFNLFSNWIKYDRSDSFLFDFEPNWITFGSKSNRRDYCHRDHVLLNLKGNGILVFSV